MSESLVAKKHPLWSKKQVAERATTLFEKAGRIFVEETLNLAKALRPNGTWGYYAYPYCFNMGANNLVANCSQAVQNENDR